MAMDKLAFVPPPYTSESFLGWLQRLAQQYDMTADQLLQSVAAAHPHLDHRLDDETTLFLASQSLSSICDLDGQMLQAMVPLNDWFLAPHVQTSMCALCWLDDIDAYRQPYYRRAWNTPSYMICEHHHSPLHEYPRQLPSLVSLKGYYPNEEGRYGQAAKLVRILHEMQQILVGNDLGEESLRTGVLNDAMTALTINLTSTATLSVDLS